MIIRLEVVPGILGPWDPTLALQVPFPMCGCLRNSVRLEGFSLLALLPSHPQLTVGSTRFPDSIIHTYATSMSCLLFFFCLKGTRRVVQ